MFIHIHKSIEAGRDQSQSHFYIIMLPTQLHSAVKGTISQFMKPNYVNLIKWPWKFHYYTSIHFQQNTPVNIVPIWSQRHLLLKSTHYKKLAPNASVHILKFEILQTTWKNKTKNIKILDLLLKNWKLTVWCSLFHFSHVICKISKFNMWTGKHLAQASCTE